MSNTYLTYEETIDRFEEDILPEVIEMFSADDEIAISQTWNDWTDGLCKDGEISTRAYCDWCYEPETKDCEQWGFDVMCAGEIIENVDSEDEAEELVYDFTDGERSDEHDGTVYYEVA